MIFFQFGVGFWPFAQQQGMDLASKKPFGGGEKKEGAFFFDFEHTFFTNQNPKKNSDGGQKKLGDPRGPGLGGLIFWDRLPKKEKFLKKKKIFGLGGWKNVVC